MEQIVEMCNISKAEMEKLINPINVKEYQSPQYGRNFRTILSVRGDAGTYKRVDQD